MEEYEFMRVFFFQAEDGIRDHCVTGVQTCALPISMFTRSNGTFISPFNLVNIALQMAAVGTIAVGVVFILLLGEIDLTVGTASGLCAGVMAVLNVKMRVPGPAAVGAGVVTGTAIGLFQGMRITQFRIPSFLG